MTENSQDAILREKLLYGYTSAVERGDLETAAAVLAQAENDPALEQMILEINGALADALPLAPKLPETPKVTVWQRFRAALRALAPGVGLSVVVLLLVFGGLALIGPSIGSTFSNAINLPVGSNVDLLIGQSAPTAPPAMAHEASSQFRVMATPQLFYATGYPAMGMPALPASTATPYLISTQVVEGPAPTTAAAEAAAQAGAGAQPRMVARTAYLSLTVAEPRKARDAVEEIISGYAGEGAFIVSSSESAVEGSSLPVISMELRVPVARYESVMSRLVGMALTVDARQEQAQDVTAEYVDAQSRIKELETAIDRLLEIASQAKSTEDLLTIEKALSDRRAELEAMKGRAQYLSQTAALSLIRLQIAPKIIYPTPTPSPTVTPQAWRPQETAHRSVRVLLEDLRRFGDAVIVFGITTLPWLAAVGLVAFGGFRLFRRGRHH